MNVKINDYYGTHMGCYNEWKKPVTILGPYMRVLQWMKKLMTIMGPYMRVLQKMKTSDYYLNPICGYCNECKW